MKTCGTMLSSTLTLPRRSNGAFSTAPEGFVRLQASEASAGSKFHHPNQKGVEPKMKCSQTDGCQLQTSSTFKRGDLGKRTCAQAGTQGKALSSPQTVVQVPVDGSSAPDGVLRLCIQVSQKGNRRDFLQIAFKSGDVLQPHGPQEVSYVASSSIPRNSTTATKTTRCHKEISRHFQKLKQVVPSQPVHMRGAVKKLLISTSITKKLK